MSEDGTCVGVEAGVTKEVGVASDGRMTISEGQGADVDGGMGVLSPVASGVCVGCSEGFGAGKVVESGVAQPDRNRTKQRSIEQDACNLFIMFFGSQGR